MTLLYIWGVVLVVLSAFGRNAEAQTAKTQLVIHVAPGDWGDSQLADIEKVLRSAANQLWVNVPNRHLNPILVERSDNGPITLYKKGPHGESLVRLDVGGRYWAQFGYQFAHEFCHILCNYERTNVDQNPNQWFEESLCETASLFALRRMAVEWKIAPPYPNWKDFVPHLDSYTKDLLQQEKRRLPRNVTLAAWYKQHEAALRSNGTDRDKNAAVASALLHLFEDNPAGWEAVTYLNLEKSEPSKSFVKYIEDWYQHAPQKHKSFVKRIGALFEIRLQ